MLKLLSGLILLFVAIRAEALIEGRLMGQSSSGQTVVFNVGSSDGVGEGDYAVLAKKVRDLDISDLRVVPAAKAKNIKLSPDSSIWILYKIYDAKLFQQGEKFIMLTESDTLRGQRAVKQGRVTIVSPKGQGSLSATEAVTQDQDRLSKLKMNYRTEAELHGKQDKIDGDVEIIDLEEWEKRKGVGYRTALYRSPSRSEFRRSFRLETFQKLVTNYLKKVNDPKFNYERFYEEQMRAEFSNDFRKRSTFNTEYEEFLHKKSHLATSDAKLFRSIISKGGRWSEEFSDEELRDIINRVTILQKNDPAREYKVSSDGVGNRASLEGGRTLDKSYSDADLRSELSSVSILQETDRKGVVVSEPLRFYANMDFGYHLSDNQKSDSLYKQSARYSVGLDFEITPFLRHDLLERFTFNGFFRSNKDSFETQNVNANMSELSIGLGANWYFFNAPYKVEVPVLFVGIYGRTGYASLESLEAKEVANYTVTSTPGLRAGVRYNFKNNVGLRITASMETLNLEQYEASENAQVLPKSETLPETTLQMGLGYLF